MKFDPREHWRYPIAHEPPTCLVEGKGSEPAAADLLRQLGLQVHWVTKAPVGSPWVVKASIADEIHGIKFHGAAQLLDGQYLVTTYFLGAKRFAATWLDPDRPYEDPEPGSLPEYIEGAVKTIPKEATSVRDYFGNFWLTKPTASRGGPHPHNIARDGSVRPFCNRLAKRSRETVPFLKIFIT